MCKSGHFTNIATAKIANFANSICPSLLKLAELAELAWREKSYVWKKMCNLQGII